MSQITLPELQLIRRLLKAHVRHTEIARRLKLGVGTVIRVATNRRLRRRKLDLLAPEELPEDDVPPEYIAANLRRCPGCGGMVYQWPCLACRLRGSVGVGECEGVREQSEYATNDDSHTPTLPHPHTSHEAA